MGVVCSFLQKMYKSHLQLMPNNVAKTATSSYSVSCSLASLESTLHHEASWPRNIVNGVITNVFT